jgi:fluoroquinolone transport system permease protein
MENRMMVSLLMILADTSMLGVIFIGALVLFEKQQKVNHALWVSPLPLSQYIFSKSLSLSLISISMSILIYLPVWEFRPYVLLIFVCVAATALTFVMLGLGIAAGAEGINRYFGILIGASMLIVLPLVPFLVLDRHPAFIWLPYVASLDLMLGILKPLPAWRMILDLALVITWLVLAYRFSVYRLKKRWVFA